MIGRLLLGPYRLAEPWLRHPNWMIRRAAQAAVLGVATIWLALLGTKQAEEGAPEGSDEFVQQLSSSTRLREFLHGRAIAKPFVGHICRVLVLRLSVHAEMRERACSDECNFALRLAGPIDQKALRNLLIWHNYVLPSYLRPDDDRQADVALVLTSGSDNEPRLFDPVSVVLMLARFRSLALFYHEETAAGAASVLMSERELGRWHAVGQASDLGKMLRDITRQVELHGTRGGLKLLPHGRKYANDFLKLALPGRFIVWVALRLRSTTCSFPLNRSTSVIVSGCVLIDTLMCALGFPMWPPSSCSIASPRRNGGSGRLMCDLHAVTDLLCKMPSASLRSPMAILASWTSLVWLPIPPIVRASMSRLRTATCRVREAMRRKLDSVSDHGWKPRSSGH